jgi:3-dehydrotetronate 4-kinase
MALLLGCIADDFTGATDLASMLVKNGMATVQVIGVPTGPLPEADAIVVALKSRTAPVAQAVAESLAAAEALIPAGAKQIFFKYCSTFDSTDEGNIGPVADALLKRLGAGFAIACPAFPANGRSIYQGHLFVGQKLLNESGMENHPLTPMKDPDLVRVLSRQTEGGVGLVPFAVMPAGAMRSWMRWTTNTSTRSARPARGMR